MSIEHLRTLALTYAPTADYSVCLDREQQLHLIALRTRLLDVQARRDRLASGGDLPKQTLGETPIVDQLAAEVADLERQLDAAQDAAAENSIVLVFRRLAATPDSADEGEPSYSEVEASVTVDGKTDWDQVGDLLLAACYLRADSAFGDVGLSWAEASRPLDDRDLDELRNMIIGHHRLGAAVPFDPRNSGRPATT